MKTTPRPALTASLSGAAAGEGGDGEDGPEDMTAERCACPSVKSTSVLVSGAVSRPTPATPATSLPPTSPDPMSGPLSSPRHPLLSRCSALAVAALMAAGAAQGGCTRRDVVPAVVMVAAVGATVAGTALSIKASEKSGPGELEV